MNSDLMVEDEILNPYYEFDSIDLSDSECLLNQSEIDEVMNDLSNQNSFSNLSLEDSKSVFEYNSDESYNFESYSSNNSLNKYLPELSELRVNSPKSLIGRSVSFENMMSYDNESTNSLHQSIITKFGYSQFGYSSDIEMETIEKLSNDSFERKLIDLDSSNLVSKNSFICNWLMKEVHTEQDLFDSLDILGGKRFCNEGNLDHLTSNSMEKSFQLVDIEKLFRNEPNTSMIKENDSSDLFISHVARNETCNKTETYSNALSTCYGETLSLNEDNSQIYENKNGSSEDFFSLSKEIGDLKIVVSSKSPKMFDMSVDDHNISLLTKEFNDSPELFDASIDELTSGNNSRNKLEDLELSYEVVDMSVQSSDNEMDVVESISYKEPNMNIIDAIYSHVELSLPNIDNLNIFSQNLFTNLHETNNQSSNLLETYSCENVISNCNVNNLNSTKTNINEPNAIESNQYSQNLFTNLHETNNQCKKNGSSKDFSSFAKEIRNLEVVKSPKPPELFDMSIDDHDVSLLLTKFNDQKIHMYPNSPERFDTSIDEPTSSNNSRNMLEDLQLNYEIVDMEFQSSDNEKNVVESITYEQPNMNIIDSIYSQVGLSPSNIDNQHISSQNIFTNVHEKNNQSSNLLDIYSCENEINKSNVNNDNSTKKNIDKPNVIESNLNEPNSNENNISGEFILFTPIECEVILHQPNDPEGIDIAIDPEVFDVVINPEEIDVRNHSTGQLSIRQQKLMDDIRNLIDNINGNLTAIGSALLYVADTTKWCNIAFKNKKLILNQNASLRKISSVNINSKLRFSIIMYLLSEIYNLLWTGFTCNLRELYYKNPNLCKNQRNVNSALNDICCYLNTSPWDLNILSSPKGLIAGPIRFIINNEIIDCNNNLQSGTLIPCVTKNFEIFDIDAKFILVVEKNTIFQKLLQHNILSKFDDSLILITGKGYPDMNTRIIINKICDKFNLPIYILVDGDPYGIEIMLTYKYGSKVRVFNSQELSCSKIKWIGLFPSEIELFSLPSIQFNKEDKKKLNSLLKRNYLNEFTLSELKIFSVTNRKSEIEALTDNSVDFLINDYLLKKINTHI